jgi:hypothetical protein
MLRGFMFDATGPAAFPPENHVYALVGFLSSNVATGFVSAINPTVAFQTGDIALLPQLRLEDGQRTIVDGLVLDHSK